MTEKPVNTPSQTAKATGEVPPTEELEPLEPDTLIIENEALRKGFTVIPNYILRNPELSPGARLTYTLLLSYAWQEGSCFPGQKRLAADIGLKERMVRYYLTELKKAGFIEVIRRGLGKTNVYIIKDIKSPDRQYIAGQERQLITDPERQKIEKLKKLKIESAKAQELASKYSPEHIEEKIEFLEWKLELQAQGKARGRPIEDSAAWLIRAIEKDYQPPKTFKAWKGKREDIARQEAEERIRQEKRKQQQEKLLQRLREKAGATDEEELDQIWSRTQAALKKGVTKATFETWIAQSRLVLLENGEAVIGFPNRYTMDWVETNLASVVQDTLSEHLEGQQVSLKFIALDQPQDQDDSPP
jgi:DNA-binding transcriptional regulator YhcF (GntR family)